jgi:hypothetical protein
MYRRMQSRLAPTLSRLTVVLLLAAAMVRGLLPAGYMLAPSADAQSIVIEMCGNGTHAYRLDLATGATTLVEDADTGNGPEVETLADCPFAVASSPAVSGGQIVVALPTMSVKADDLGLPADMEGQGAPAGLPPPARGPPDLI